MPEVTLRPLITHLDVRDDLPAQDGLELPRTNLARLVAQRPVPRHVHEVRLGHVDPVVLRSPALVLHTLPPVYTWFYKLQPFLLLDMFARGFHEARLGHNSDM